MAEFVGEDKRRIVEGEQVFINRTSQRLSVTTGIVFNKDGDYSVSVHEGRIIVTEEPFREEPVRRAHWIWKGDEGDSRFMCSECGGKEYVPTCMGIPNIWEYCPNCGAKMEEYENWKKAEV